MNGTKINIFFVRRFQIISMKNNENIVFLEQVLEVSFKNNHCFQLCVSLETDHLSKKINLYFFFHFCMDQKNDCINIVMFLVQ